MTHRGYGNAIASPYHQYEVAMSSPSRSVLERVIRAVPGGTDPEVRAGAPYREIATGDALS